MGTKAAFLVAAGLLCLLVGCRNTALEPTAKHRGKHNIVGFDGSETEKLLIPGNPSLKVATLRWEDKPILIVWTDANAYSGASPENLPTLKYTGTLTYDQAKSCSFNVEIQDVEKAQFNFAGKTYDVAEGACFLISGMHGELRAKQMKVDITKLKFTKEGFLSFAATEPEIKAFFGNVRAN